MATKTKTATIVISYSGALGALYRGSISAADLDGAFFYFGCSRRHIFADGVGGTFGELQYYYRKDPHGVWAAYRIVLEALAWAEGTTVQSQEDYSVQNVVVFTTKF